MSAFTSPLELEYVDGRCWKVTAEFDFASDVLEHIVRIPAGFITDFASIPRLFWNILPPTGTYGKAAVIHDMLYQHPECITPTATEKQANSVLLEGMITLHTGWLTALVIYTGVKFFGWFAWNHYRNQSPLAR
jgi:ABC-type glucose/galactose transport system permease subunit